MKFDVRYPNHPQDVKAYNTEELREHFLISEVFRDDDVCLTYSHQDRIIAGGAKPVKKELTLTPDPYMACSFFLERREIGIINVGGDGYIVADGEKIQMNARDGLYLGRGIKEVVFGSLDPKNPAKFYLNSCPAHKTYPTVHIPFSKTNPRTVGSAEQMNARTIYQYINKTILDTCQLQMGLTILEKGSSWNTMPCHLHERRMEVYFYFDFPESQRVMHLMGRPEQTRHLFVKPEQGVISPAWSIHAGVGTINYTFIWGMCGENQDYDDMNFIDTKDLR